MIELDKKNDIEKTAASLIDELIIPGRVDDFIEIGDVEVPTDKIASIDPYDWKEILPRPIVEAMFEGDTMDTSVFKEVTASMSNDEKQAILEFIRDNSGKDILWV
jgi:hypothetical protein